ncbi:unnamed protein product [Linum trigynum]
MAVLVVAGYLTTISLDVAVAQTPQQYCSSSAPEDPVKYYSYAEKVMNALVKRAPYTSTRMFKAWYPNKKVGSVTGAATCYNNDAGRCKDCLKALKASMEGCKMSITGGSFGTGCNMQFWRVVD